jgi:hypothetical protein
MSMCSFVSLLLSHLTSPILGHDGYLHKACGRIYDADKTYYVDLDWTKTFTYEQAMEQVKTRSLQVPKDYKVCKKARSEVIRVMYKQGRVCCHLKFLRSSDVVCNISVSVFISFFAILLYLSVCLFSFSSSFSLPSLLFVS